MTYVICSCRLADVERTTIHLPPELRQRLADEARREGRAQAIIVREALERYLSRRRPERPRLVGVVSRGDADARRAKQWVREQWAKDAPRGRKPKR